jgi:hypothetical protein
MTALIIALDRRAHVGVSVTSPNAVRSRSDEYLANAAECEEIANHWPDLIKSQYQELARQWRALAKQVDRHF